MRAKQVLALDLSPYMIRLAKERSAPFSNIDFQITEVMAYDFPAASFDCIVSIATMHHLPIEKILAKMKNALKPNGTLIVLDLLQLSGLSGMPINIAALAVSAYQRLINNGRWRSPRELRQAWAEHGRNETYLTMPQVYQIYLATLPGAQVQQHLLWRYSVIWKK